MASATSTTQGLEDSPLNFIYACSVCCATFADTYEGHNETVQGLSDGINPKERLVTRLYLGSCCHVFCGEHIEGGGPPFHPADQKPKAPCPICVKEKGDDTARELYSIRGFNKHEYDPAIPPIWFRAPPIDLGGNTKETEALRFQYLALIRYCQTSYRTQKPLSSELESLRQELATAESRTADERSKVVALQHENGNLQAAAQQCEDLTALRKEVERLQQLERDVDQFHADLESFRRLKVDVRDLEVFRKNKPAVMQNLKLVPRLVEQNGKMQDRLRSLGFAMAVDPIPNYTQLTSDALNELGEIPEVYSEDDRQFQRSSSSRTIGRAMQPSGDDAVTRPLKRQRIDSPLPHDMHVHTGRSSSRDGMPPPSKPLSRMPSMRGLIPTIRKKFTSSRSMSKGPRNKTDDSQMYISEFGRDATAPQGHDELHGETSYMTGALPVEPPLKGSHMFVPEGVHTTSSEFTFRTPSPVKTSIGQDHHKPVQLPTEPSYLHLMDRLSHDNGLELGLRDPRQKAPESYDDNTPYDRHQTQDPHMRQCLGLGHAFLHQPPNGPIKQANYPRSSPIRKSKGHFSRAHYKKSLDSTNLAPDQLLQTAHEFENVVSPFFGRDLYDAHTPRQHRITETQTSSRSFGAYLSQKRPVPPISTEWREPRSLNGLSFIDLPLNSRNAPILKSEIGDSFRGAPTQSHQLRNIDSYGLVMRSDNHRPRNINSSGYGPVMNNRSTFSQQLQVQPQFPDLHPSTGRAPLPRLGNLPSVLPSINMGHSPARIRFQWETLQHAGVRSSRRTHAEVRGNTFRSTW